MFNNSENRMRADFYIHKLSNDMKLAVQNHLGAQILYRSRAPYKKRRQYAIFGALL